MAYSVIARRRRGDVAARPGQVFEEAGGGVLYDMALVRLVLAVQGQYLREDARELRDVVAHQIEVVALEITVRVQEGLWTFPCGTGTLDFQHTGFDERGQPVRLAVVRLEAVFQHEVAEQAVGIGNGIPDVEAVVHHAVGIVVDVVLQRLDMGTGVFAGSVARHGEYGWGSHASMVARPANRASKK